MFELNEEDKKILREDINNMVKKLYLKQFLSEALYKNTALKLPTETQPNNNESLTISHYNIHMQPLLLCNNKGEVLHYNGNTADPTPVSLIDYYNISPMSLNDFDSTSLDSMTYQLARKMLCYLLKKFNLIRADWNEDTLILFNDPNKPENKLDTVLKSLPINEKIKDSRDFKYPDSFKKEDLYTHKKLMEAFLAQNSEPLKADYFLENSDIGLAINNQVIYKLKLIDLTLYFNNPQFERDNKGNFIDNRSTVDVDKIQNYNFMSENLLARIYSNYPYTTIFNDSETKIEIYNYLSDKQYKLLKTLKSDKTENLLTLYIFAPLFSWDQLTLNKKSAANKKNKTGITSNLTPSTDDNYTRSTEELNNQKRWVTARTLYNRLKKPNSLIKGNSTEIADPFVDNDLAETWFDKITKELSIDNKCKILIPRINLEIDDTGNLSTEFKYDWDIPKKKQPVMYLSWQKQQGKDEVRGTKYIDNFNDSGQNLFLTVSLQDNQGNIYSPTSFRDVTKLGDYKQALSQHSINSFAAAFTSEGSWNTVTSKYLGGARLQNNVPYSGLGGYLSTYKQERLGYLNFVLDLNTLLNLIKKEQFLKSGISNAIYDTFATAITKFIPLTIYADDRTSLGFQQFLLAYSDLSSLNYHDVRVGQGFVGIMAYYLVLIKIIQYALTKINNLSYFDFTNNNNFKAFKELLESKKNLDELLKYLNSNNFNGNIKLQNKMLTDQLSIIKQAIIDSDNTEDDKTDLQDNVVNLIIDCIKDLGNKPDFNSFKSLLDVFNINVDSFEPVFNNYFNSVILSIYNSTKLIQNHLIMLLNTIEKNCNDAETNLEHILSNSLIHRSDITTYQNDASKLADNIYNQLKPDNITVILNKMIQSSICSAIVANDNEKQQMSAIFKEKQNPKGKKLKEHLKQQLKIKK